jgi:hypothetical protein
MFALEGLISPIVSDLASIGVIISTLGWVLVTGTMLEKKKYGALNRLTYKRFISIGIVLIVTTCIGQLLLFTQAMSSANVQIGLMIYDLISVFWITTFAARSLKSNETSEEIDINDYFGDIFLFMLWPIGVWIIQPRVNKIFSANMSE